MTAWGRTFAASSAFLALGLLLLPGQAAAADPVAVSITDVSQNGTDVAGLLTLRSQEVVTVDPSTLRATMDGAQIPVTVEAHAPTARRSMLVIDTSGSMGAAGMSAVRAATRAYLAAVPKDVSVGVVSFAKTAGVDLAPTTSHAAVQRVVDSLTSDGDTALY
jgi:tight adherence protein B